MRTVAPGAGLAFGASCLVDDPFENPDDRIGGQWSCQAGGGVPYAAEHLCLAIGLIDGQPETVLDATDLDRALPKIARNLNIRVERLIPADESLESVFSYLLAA